MKLPITAFINAFNEEEELPSLIDNLKDVDEIIVIDHQSTDSTPVLAKKLGAKVFTRGLYTETVTDLDVEEFEKRYGIKPHFKTGDTMSDGARDFNQNVKYCKNDWILYIDCDERVIWDIQEIKKLLPHWDVITCSFISDHNEDKSPKSSFVSKKLFRRSKTYFTCRIHTMVYGFDLKEVFTDKMKVDHWQKPREYRKEYVNRLEFAFLKEQSLRMNYYLAREYFHSREFEKSLKFFHIYLQNATYLPEIGKAYTLMSGCLWELGKIEDSFIALFQAMRIYPYSKMTFDMMGRMIAIKHPEYQEIWNKFRDMLPSEHF